MNGKYEINICAFIFAFVLLGKIETRFVQLWGKLLYNGKVEMRAPK